MFLANITRPSCLGQAAHCSPSIRIARLQWYSLLNDAIYYVIFVNHVDIRGLCCPQKPSGSP